MLALSLAASTSTAAADTITLLDAVDAALKAHPNLQRSAAEREASEARIGRTRAGFLPQVQASASIRDDVSDPLNFVSSDPIGWGNQFGYDASLGVNQLLTDSGRTRSAIDGARAGELQARRQIAVDRLDVELAVVRAYLDILRHRDLLAVSTGAIALVEEQLQRASALFRATLRPEIDVLSAETQLAQARLQRLRDDNAIATAQVTLQNAIGAGTARSYDAAAIEIAPVVDETRGIGDLATLALGARPELAVLQAAIASGEANVRVAQTRLSPVVSASAGAYANGNDQSWIPGVGVFASLGVSMDLYVGGANTYEISEGRAQLRSTQAELVRVEQAIAASVGRAALAVQISREALDVASAWRVQAERQLQLAQSRYQSGVGNFVELNDARTGLVNAQRQEVSARYDLAQSRVVLARELGRPPSGLATQP